jgi:LuxR family maltose regulon positive regulatory protein
VSSNAFDQASLNLTRTKLYRPLVGDGLVRRARLLDLLNQGRHLPLTLVSAPAGSGKTTLLSDWLSICPCPSAWLSLDQGDSHLPIFLNYLLAAIRAVVPEACEQTLGLLQASELPPVHVLASRLVNDLESLQGHPALGSEESFVLVLDDFYRITGQAVNELLIEILRHPPRTMRLVLATRVDPALPLAGLRARGQLLEIRRQELRFTREETECYLQQSTPQPLSEEAVALLEEMTEGWITGLRLAVLNLRETPDSDQFVAGLLANERYVMDYLLDEVLAHQPRPLQSFLLRTSVLERLCGPLCEAVAGLREGEGQRYLDQIEQANLFLVALDDERHCYRYHHLFRQLLRSRLERRENATQIAQLHSRASAWYAQQGFVAEAITHALAAGDEEAAVQVVEAHRHPAMNQERWQQLDHWLHLLPRQLAYQRPELLLAAVWILVKQWRFVDIPPVLARIETLVESSPSPESAASLWRAELDALRSLLYYYALDGERAFFFANRALQTLPMSCSSARGLAWMYYGGGLQAMGDIPGARSALQEGLKEDALHSSNAFPARVLTALCIIHWITGDLAGLSHTATHFLRLAEERNLVESRGWARYFRGCAAYQMNNLAAAADDFAAVVEQRYVAHSMPFSQSVFGLASIQVAQGAADQAHALVESLFDYCLEMNTSRVLADAQAFQAHLALQQGRRAEAYRWAETLDRNAPLTPMITLNVPAFTLADVLLDMAQPTSLQEAADLLTRLRSHAAGQGNTRIEIDVLARQALVDSALGDQPAALRALREALDLAEPGGAVRAFVDLGPKMAHLLASLSEQDGPSDFLGRVLRAFPSVAGQGSDRLTSTPSTLRQADMIEPLTLREQEVLELLTQRLSAKEIAQRLFISDRTVKRHLANIYDKLGVHSRREAVALALALGLLSP